MCGPQDLQKELQNQQGSIDSTRESLNTLCRKYPSEELAGLGSALTDLIKSYEAVNQLSARTLGSLQHVLQHHFNGGQIRVKGVEGEAVAVRMQGWVKVFAPCGDGVQ